MTKPLTQAQLNNLGSKVTSRQIVWSSLVQQLWGEEYRAPDRGVYEFTGGRKFDSSDMGNTGIYGGGVNN